MMHDRGEPQPPRMRDGAERGENERPEHVHDHQQGGADLGHAAAHGIQPEQMAFGAARSFAGA